MGTRRHAGTRTAVRTLACAISGAAAALLLAAAGCQNDLDPETGLNPRPEELPSATVPGAGESENVTPVRETCEDNALLAGCAPADPAAGAPLGGEPPADSEDVPNGLNAGGADAGTADVTGLGVDAGALLAGDAGAP